MIGTGIFSRSKSLTKQSCKVLLKKTADMIDRERGGVIATGKDGTDHGSVPEGKCILNNQPHEMEATYISGVGGAVASKPLSNLVSPFCRTFEFKASQWRLGMIRP
ncbi:hypothetical protein PoB_007084300 [Plakobranchus ocellatus]|uniref:Uncharacterized protein n=1 Tax=Plakobranchus ocellatus TaxID=259542 RepID=A0AAV4DJC4_9GAST|nr:hypothetical protein PoB_007084300 [Plakobranchus ocellatus]